MNSIGRIYQRFLFPAIFVSLFMILGCPKGEKQPEGAAGQIVQGSWTGTAQQTGSPNPTFTLKLNAKEGGEVWGTITSMDGTFAESIISGGKMTDHNVTFSATSNGSNFRNGHIFSFEAGIQGDQMDGVWTDILERSRGPFTLIREKAPVKAEEGKDASPAKDKKS
ncbi:MAG: hypothetical protein AABY87_05175 [bacterium]